MAVNHLYEMNTRQIEALSKRTRLAFLPVGPTEVHAPHLPVCTDIARAIDMSVLTARRFLAEDGIESLIAPSVNYAPADCSNVFYGGTSIRQETCEMIIEDICESLIKWGFDKIAVMCGHHDPSCMGALENAADRIMSRFTDARVIVAKWSPDTQVAAVMRGEHPEWDMHAGELETSVMMAMHPELVDEPACRELKPNWEGEFLFERIAKGMNFIELGATLCYLGDPASASPETGKKILELQCDFAYKELQALFK